MIKVVLDTNILVSGLISPKGAPAKLIELWQKRKYILVVSKETINELKKVLTYPRIAKNYHLNQAIINEYIKGLLIFAEVCRPTKKISLIKDDPDDNKFIEAAIAGKADFIISGDQHLLSLGKYQGIKIITPANFLLEIKRL